MKEKSGIIFSIAKDNIAIPGCTVSKEIYKENGNNITYYSLADGTDISAEIYSYNKLVLMAEGKIEVFTKKTSWELKQNECFVTPIDVPVGMRAKSPSVYIEIALRRIQFMNKVIKESEIFSLTELVPYQAGKIVNMDILNEKHMKFVVMSFDEGTGLDEHAAPGEALIFALDGEGIIGYKGKEYTIKAGENFKFEKGGEHYVKAKEKFKMALLLTLE